MELFKFLIHKIINTFGGYYSFPMKNYLFIPILFTAFVVGAQDTIIKTNGDLIKAKITEIGTEEVKFRIFGEQGRGDFLLYNKDDPVIRKGIRRAKAKKIS